jgi:lipopolysaccharide biosynthesis protein
VASKFFNHSRNYNATHLQSERKYFNDSVERKQIFEQMWTKCRRLSHTKIIHPDVDEIETNAILYKPI